MSDPFPIGSIPGDPGYEAVASRIVTLDYTNHRGVRRLRRVTPERIWFGTSPYHPGDQWFLHARDEETGEGRDFALDSIHAWVGG